MKSQKNTSFVVSTALAALVVVQGQLFAQAIPPIGDLSGTQGAGPGEVMLTWNTPLFDNPDPNYSFDCSYEFRVSDVPIDNGNWAAATTKPGDFAGVLALCASVQLDLRVSGYLEGTTIHPDRARMRAYLTIEFNCANFYFPGGQPLSGETIWFEVYDESDTQVVFQTVVTDQTGMAELITEDLWDGLSGQCSDVPFHFVARWDGHTIGGTTGMIAITMGDQEDTQDMYLCEGDMEIPDDMWSGHGGVYSGMLGNVTFEFTVPAEAVVADVPVMLAPPGGPLPPPTGMKPGVPGAMVAFELQKFDGPYLDKPILITMTYPPEELNQYGGLGESSLRGYWFDGVAGSWVLLHENLLKLDRQAHKITFQADQLGLFAIAAETDADGDGMGDVEELHYGTNPSLTDTDGDGISDGDEIWFTNGDPLDVQKLDGDDQHSVVRGLTPGEYYYIAGRILGVAGQSDVSNWVYVQAGRACAGSADINCDGETNLYDLALLGGQWMQ